MHTLTEQPPLEIAYDPQAGQYTAMLTLDGTVTFREAPELRRRLLEAIEAHPARNLVVELSQVDRFDTAAMAVLLEILIQTHKQGPEVYLVGANEAVTKVFKLAGFEEALLRCFGCMDDVHQQIKH
jgi:anti-anti-sigma factor